MLPKEPTKIVYLTILRWADEVHEEPWNTLAEARRRKRLHHGKIRRHREIRKDYRATVRIIKEVTSTRRTTVR